MSAVREVELLCEDFDKSMPFIAGKIRAAIGELEKERDEWKNAAYEETRVVVHCKARIHELEERLKR